MSTLMPSTTLSDKPICSHTSSIDYLMISQYWGKSADTMYMDGKLKIDELVSRTFTLEQVNEAYDILTEGGVARGVVQFF